MGGQEGTEGARTSSDDVVRPAEYFSRFSALASITNVEEFPDHRSKRVADYEVSSKFLNDPLAYNDVFRVVGSTSPGDTLPLAVRMGASG